MSNNDGAFWSWCFIGYLTNCEIQQPFLPLAGQKTPNYAPIIPECLKDLTCIIFHVKQSNQN